MSYWNSGCIGLRWFWYWFEKICHIDLNKLNTILHQLYYNRYIRNMITIWLMGGSFWVQLAFLPSCYFFILTVATPIEYFSWDCYSSHFWHLCSAFFVYLSVEFFILTTVNIRKLKRTKFFSVDNHSFAENNCSWDFVLGRTLMWSVDCDGNS